MKKFVYLLISILFLASCQGKDTRVLVLYENSGHHKAFTDAILPWLREAAPAEGLILTEIQSPDVIDEQYLAGFDVVLQLDFPPYMWPEKAVSAFEAFLDEGRGGWVGLHHASLLGEFDGYAMWPWFSDLLGRIRYENYIAELSDGEVTVQESGHPVFEGIPSRFVIPDDEWYIYDRNPRLCPDVRVLATVDEESYTVDTPVKMGDHPVIWTNTAKAGRNVYFQFGHSPRLAQDEVFKKMLLNALLWASNE